MSNEKVEERSSEGTSNDVVDANMIRPVEPERLQTTETSEIQLSGSESDGESESDAEDSENSEDSEDSEEDEGSKFDDSLCCICQELKWKYRCPGCNRCTCCLKCCNEHKARFSCTGKRKRSEMVFSVKEMDDKTLLEDYYLMEDAGRFVGGADRGQSKRGRFPKRPHRLRKLISMAKSKDIQLSLLPESFEKHKMNTSAWDDRGKCVKWTVKWVFEKAQSQYVEHHVRGDTPISRLLTNFLGISPDTVVRRHKLKTYIRPGSNELDHLRVQMKLEGRPANSPKFIICETNQGLDDFLKGQQVFEFPVLHVVHRDTRVASLTQDAKIVK